MRTRKPEVALVFACGFVGLGFCLCSGLIWFSFKGYFEYSLRLLSD